MNTMLIDAYTSGTIFTLEKNSQLGIECHSEEQRPQIIKNAKANKSEVIQWLIDNKLTGQRFSLERSVIAAYRNGVTFRLNREAIRRIDSTTLETRGRVLTVLNPNNDINGLLVESAASREQSAVIQAVILIEAKRKKLMQAMTNGSFFLTASDKREIQSMAELFGVQIRWTKKEIK